MVTTTTQCLVIGGGITGLSTALYLARKGVKVTVIDRCDSLSSQLKASNVNCGIVCGAPHAGPGLGQELFGRSLEVAKKMGDDAKYVHSGSLEVLMTEAECQWGKALVEVQRGLGFGPDQIAYLTPAEAQTGPAKRNDKKTIEKHLHLLNDSPYEELYQNLTNAILKKYNNL